MKKYIRTKDGRIFAPTNAYYLKEDNSLICYEIGKGEWGEPIMIDVNLVIKAADTIEELCDEYVVKHINSLTPMLIDKFTISLKDIKTQYSGNDNFEYIYGAIWTDKGLIYVAKMNEKGELELI